MGKPWLAQRFRLSPQAASQPAVCRQLLGSLSQPLQVVNAESIETETQTVPTALPLRREGRLGLARAIDCANSKAC